MEIFDELDENGGFTGRTCLREEAHAKGFWHRAVVLFLVNSKAQVLLQKRSLLKKWFPGLWAVSAGGHVESGELGLCSVVREVKEEIGIDITEQDVRYICGCKSEIKTEKVWDRHHNEYFVAFKDVDIEQLKIQEGEVDELKWMDIDAFAIMVANRAPELTPYWEAYEALFRYLSCTGAAGVM